MNKNLLALLIIVWIVVKPFSKGFINLAGFSIWSILYYLVLLVLGFLFIRAINPSRNFWIYMVIYLIAVVAMILLSVNK